MSGIDMTTVTETSSTPQTYTNVHGRRGGRGVRPWLLVPKIILVAMYLGGLATVTFIWLSSDYANLAADDPRRAWVLNLVGRLMVFFVVPALLVAIVFGVVLLLQHPRHFLRMRWLRVKLVLLLILIPSGHFWCRTQTLKLRDTTASADVQADAARGLSFGLVVTLIGSIAVVVLARAKPRLGGRHSMLARR